MTNHTVVRDLEGKVVPVTGASGLARRRCGWPRKALVTSRRVSCRLNAVLDRVV